MRRDKQMWESADSFNSAMLSHDPLLRRVVHLERLRQREGFLGQQVLIEGTGVVRVQVVLHEYHASTNDLLPESAPVFSN
jgi:hypothetical protein